MGKSFSLSGCAYIGIWNDLHCTRDQRKGIEIGAVIAVICNQALIGRRETGKIKNHSILNHSIVAVTAFLFSENNSGLIKIKYMEDEGSFAFFALPTAYCLLPTFVFC